MIKTQYLKKDKKQKSQKSICEHEMAFFTLN